jgi:DedD protein
MAILEGRQPSGGSQSTSGSSSGSYVLQIASYGSQADAQARVETLKSQGVSNAFVEPATVNDKPTFRLRVGPFDSNSAAQAAQARLRTLGYDNGFITTK